MSKPRVNKEEYRIKIFDKGLNTKFGAPDVPEGASPDLNDIQFTSYGAIETAYGYNTPFDQIASSPIDGLHPVGSNYMLSVCNNGLYKSSGTTNNTFLAVTESTGVYTSGVDTNMYQYKGYTWINNGYARGYKYNGTTFSQAGVSALTSDQGTIVSGAIGDLDGEYIWAITGVNDANSESDYFELNTAAVTIASGEAVITGIPEFPTSANVSTKYLYRNTAGVAADAGIYYRVTALSAAQTAYTDVNADNILSTDEAPSDNNVMPPVAYVVEYLGTLFGAGDPSQPSGLYYSTAAQPETWPAANILQIGEDDGFPITGLRVYNNALYIQKNDGRGNGSIYVMYVNDPASGSSPSNWYITKSNSAYGGQSHKSIAQALDSLVFVDANGVRRFNNKEISLNPQESSVGLYLVDSISEEIEPDIQSLNNSALNKAAMIDYKNRLYLSAPDGTGTTNDKLFTYDYSTVSSRGQAFGAWSRLSNAGLNNFAKYNGKLYGGDYDGNIVDLNLVDTYNADGSALDSYFWTNFVYGSDSHRDFTKCWRYLYIEVYLSGEYNLKVTYRQDTGESGNTTQLPLSQDISKWGQMVWGIDYWDVGFERRIYRLSLAGMVSRMIQFKFSIDEADAWFRLYNMKVAYTLKGQR